MSQRSTHVKTQDSGVRLIDGSTVITVASVMFLENTEMYCKIYSQDNRNGADQV